jgi:hypothetical protein
LPIGAAERREGEANDMGFLLEGEPRGSARVLDF